MPSIHGEDAVLRVLDKESMSEKFRKLNLDVVGFDDDTLRRFRRYIHEPYGMVLVTGPTGSGKTTSLYAALNEMPRTGSSRARRPSRQALRSSGVRGSLQSASDVQRRACAGRQQPGCTAAPR